MANRDESFFARLTRLFRSGPSIRRKVKGYDDSGYYDKKAAGAAGGSGMLPFRKGSSQNSQFSMMGGSDMMSRMTRYIEFGEMEYTPIISKALDIQADEACSGDEKGKNFHIYSDNAQIKIALEELFYDILNVDFNLRPWIRNLVKYGDMFLYNEVAPGVGVVNVMAMNVNEVERDENFDPEDPYAVRFKWHKYGQKHLENWQVTHFRIIGNDLFMPYGTSLLESARRIWRQYVMMVDAMLVYRLVRSPERRVFYVDVGTVAANDIPNYMQTIMGTIKGSMTVDQSTGRMDERYNASDVLEDYVIPVRGANSGTKIDTLAGATNNTATEDIELIQSQLFAALGVPKAYLGYDEMLSSKATLAQEDIRFSRTIQILQKVVVSELNKLAILHLYAKGFDGEDLIDFELRLSNPSTIALQQKLDLWKTKIDIIGAVDNIETKFLPRSWLYKEILGFTDDEIQVLDEKLRDDKKFAAELDSITGPDAPLGANTVDPFDPAGYGLPGGQKMTPGAFPAPSSTSQGVTGGIIGIGNGQDRETLRLSLGDREAPIKDNPAVKMDKRNTDRRRSNLAMQADQPDFRKMLHPGKNKSLSDIYDTEFLKNPLGEALIRHELKLETSKNSFLSTEMKRVLENFDKAKRIIKNELPVDIEMLHEGEDSKDDDDLIDLDILLLQEEVQGGEKEIRNNSNKAYSPPPRTLAEVGDLGDLQELAESITGVSPSSSSSDNKQEDESILKEDLLKDFGINILEADKDQEEE